GLARGSQSGGVQQLPARVVDDVGILATVIGFDPFVVAGHRHDCTAAGERAAEHPISRDGLHTGVDRPGPLVLRPRRMKSPPSTFEPPLHLASVVNELPHDRRLGTRSDRVDRLPLASSIIARCDVGVQEPGAVELQAESTAHGCLPWGRGPAYAHFRRMVSPLAPTARLHVTGARIRASRGRLPTLIELLILAAEFARLV